MPSLSHFFSHLFTFHQSKVNFRPAIFASSVGLISHQALAVEIDGQLTEAQWQDAKTLILDKTVWPFNLTNAPLSTQVKYFTTEDGIYVGVIASQKKSEQTAMRTARDSDLESDSIELIIDFDNSQNSAYGFELGNGGSMLDGIWQNNNQFKTDWDGHWLGKTSQQEDAWIAEYMIPWTVAPMAEVSGNVRDVRIYVARHDIKSGNSYSHVATAQSQANFIREFAPIQVDNFAAASLDIFASATYQRDMLNSANSSNVSADVFWRPDASQQVSLALNPDFGQVESDSLVVDFSPFETFFAERRPFFTQNQALFDVQGNAGLRLVHTRRIGVDGDILGAMKYTKNSQNIDFGAMLAIEDDTREAELEGNRFVTARGQYKFKTAQLGYLATYADKPSQDKQAQVHSVDFRKEINGNVQIQGQLSGSFVAYDNDNNDNNDNNDEQGQGAWFNIVHKFSDTWQQRLNLTRFSDDFQVNDLGFLSRTDLTRAFYANERDFTEFSEQDSLKQRSLAFGGRVDYNAQGEHLETNLFVTGSEEYKDTSVFQWSIDYFTNGLDDRLTRGNGDFNTDAGQRVFMEYNFGNQSKFRHHTALILHDEGNDGKGARFHYHPSYYFTDNLRISWSMWYRQQQDGLLWMNEQLARYKYKNLNNGIDFDATLDDKQELRVRFQWISVTGKEGVAQTIDQKGDLFSTETKVDDFSRSTTRFQVRYRYELAPLSNIYLVYSRGGFSENDLQQSNLALFDEGWGERTGDNFVAKIRYRF